MIDYTSIGTSVGLFAVAFWKIWSNRKHSDANHAATHQRLDAAGISSLPTPKSEMVKHSEMVLHAIANPPRHSLGGMTKKVKPKRKRK